MSVASELNDSKHSPNLMLEISFLEVIFFCCQSYSHTCKICNVFERFICCVGTVLLHSTERLQKWLQNIADDASKYTSGVALKKCG